MSGLRSRKLDLCFHGREKPDVMTWSLALAKSIQGVEIKDEAFRV